MEKLLYETIDKGSPAGRPKVYFSCHPADHERAFNKVKEDIFRTHDCAVFYRKDNNLDEPDDTERFDLEQMELFVIPISYRLLTEPNRTMTFDFPFAQEKNIPVLPIMIDPNENGQIEEIYSKPENFGALQFLSKYDHDKTAISYEEKLEKYLENVLVSSEIIEQVKKEFRVHIFLSYRKDDRKYANELMKKIHAIPGSRDIAIWYDEFLVPGESFSDSIKENIRTSNLFMMLVTEKLLNIPNYVKTEEYPEALRAGIPLFPAQSENVDRKKLYEIYSGLPECVKTSNMDAFIARLTALLPKAEAVSDEPAHLYMMGLAYLHGIDVEFNTQLGIQLLEKAARADCPDAIRKLYLMYTYGNGVRRDAGKAVEWSKLLWEHYAPHVEDDPEAALESLSFLVLALSSAGYLQDSLKYNEQNCELNEKIYGENSIQALNALHNYANALRENGIYEKAVEVSGNVYTKLVEVFGEENLLTIRALNNYGLSCIENSEYEKAVTLLERGISVSAKALGEDNADTLMLYGNLALAYSKKGSSFKAMDIEKDISLRKAKLLGGTHPDTLFSLSNLAYYCNICGDHKQTIHLNTQCYDIRCRVLGKAHPDTLTSLNNLVDAYLSNGDYNKAYKPSKKCYELRAEILGKDHAFTLLSMNNYASCCYYLKKNKAAIELAEKCYEMQCRTRGENNPDTLITMGNLAMFRAGHNYENVDIAFLTDCFERKQKVLGYAHIETLSTMRTLVQVTLEKKDFDTVIKLAKDCRKRTKTAFYADHPIAIEALMCESLAYMEKQRFDKSSVLLKRCHSYLSKNNGEYHPNTQRALYYLLISCIRNGDREQTTSICSRVSMRLEYNDADLLQAAEYAFRASQMDSCADAILKRMRSSRR